MNLSYKTILKQKIFLTAAILMQSVIAFGQAGINTDTPKASLDVVAKKDGSAEGVIAPRLTGDQMGSALYSTDQKGALAYARYIPTVANPKTVNVTKEGYYYFDGSVWVGFSSSSGTTTFVPYTVASGQESEAIKQCDQLQHGVGYTAWHFKLTVDDGNWHNNIYTVPETGFYQVTLQGVVQPLPYATSALNSFAWTLNSENGSGDFTFFSMRNRDQKNNKYNAGGAVVLHFNQGDKFSLGGVPCISCSMGGSTDEYCTSYSYYLTTTRSFSIVFLGKGG
ncbi:MAG: hypothetical protein ACK5MD_00300 [Flavobacteriales bacterium]